MPALIFLGRKWLIACDDFVVPCAIEAALRIIWCVVTSTVLCLKISNCDESDSINYFLYAASGNFLLTSCLTLGIAITSSRGTVLEVEKRKLVSTLWLIKLITVLWDLTLASLGIWFFTQVQGTCIAKEILVKFTTLFLWGYFCLLLIAILVCYDSLGSSKYWDIEASTNSLNFFKKAQYIWRLRLKLFCCCADISEKNDLIYVDISTFLASFLNGIDLVPTDILAGIITLSQKHVLERRKHMLVHIPVSVELLDNTPVPDWMTIENALYFLKISKSTYGWIAYLDAFAPWNICKLTSPAGCCMTCCTPNTERKVDNCCYLNLAAVKKKTGFADSDILYASFRNSIHEPAFFVAIDHRKKYVIIAIRGTRSFSDLVTDIDAENLDFPSESQPTFRCHRGALRSALFLQKKISELNVLDIAFSENPTYTLSLTGHSLGGSIAAILSLILLPKYPSLQCYAFAPLSVLSALGLSKTLSCVLSIVVGEDMTPRFSAHSCNKLRKEIIDSLRESKTPKYQILVGACWYHIQKFFNAPPPRPIGEVYENKLCEDDEAMSSQDDPNFDEESKLFAPGRILYFERKNWSKPFWLTGLNLQSIIINPDMISDHQPSKIQYMLEMYLKSLEDNAQTVID